MRMDEQMIAMAVELIRLDRERFREALDRLEPALGDTWDLRHVAIPGKHALCARTRDGRQLSFDEWHAVLHGGGSTTARMVPLAAREGEQARYLPATGRRFALEIHNGEDRALYVPREARERGAGASPETLVELARMQPRADLIFDQWALRISAYEAEKGRAAVEPAEIEAYLRRPFMFEFFGDPLLRDLQIVSRRAGVKESVPDSLRHFLREPTETERRIARRPEVMVAAARPLGPIPENEALHWRIEPAPHASTEFSDVTDEHSTLPSLSAPLERLRADFAASLGKASESRRRTGSRDFALFDLARLELEDEGFPLPATPPEHDDAVDTALIAYGFGDSAGKLLRRSAAFFAWLAAFNPSDMKRRGLLACSLVDGFHEPLQAEPFDTRMEASALFFEPWRAFFAALVGSR